MTSLIHLSPLLKCLRTVCPSSLHSCVQGTNFSPSEPPGEIMSFGVSPVNYSDSDSLGITCIMVERVGLITAGYCRILQDTAGLFRIPQDSFNTYYISS